MDKEEKAKKEMEMKKCNLIDERYIYESPDGGKTIYRRRFGDYDHKERIK